MCLYTSKRKKEESWDSVAKTEGSSSEKCWGDLCCTTPAYLQAQGQDPKPHQTHCCNPGTPPLISVLILELPKHHMQLPHVPGGVWRTAPFLNGLEQSSCQLGPRNKTFLQMRADLYGFWRTCKGYRGNSCFLLKHGQRRRRAHFSHNSLVVWAVTQQTRKQELLPGLFQCFIYFGVSLHWINILGIEGPSLFFLAQCILGSFPQHIRFLSVTQ